MRFKARKFENFLFLSENKNRGKLFCVFAADAASYETQEGQAQDDASCDN
jgi:hypothetical protein